MNCSGAEYLQEFAVDMELVLVGHRNVF
jgi:hypothetical protein